jgi:hypothetical protein
MQMSVRIIEETIVIKEGPTARTPSEATTVNVLTDMLTASLVRRAPTAARSMNVKRAVTIATLGQKYALTELLLLNGSAFRKLH